MRMLPMMILVLAGLPAAAQQAPNPSPLAVELAIPFGTVPGKLLLLGNHIVFLDEQQPETSVVIPKGVIDRLTAEGAAITIQMKEPVRGRSGELRLLNFRVSTGGDPAIITNWFASGAGKSAQAAPDSPAPAAAAVPASMEATTYQVRHNHRIGYCKGRLLIGVDQVRFESVDSLSHSRRWEYKAIKETSLPNPYELELKTFSGGTYKFFLDGSGMEPAAYKSLDSLRAAAVGRDALGRGRACVSAAVAKPERRRLAHDPPQGFQHFWQLSEALRLGPMRAGSAP